MILFTPGKIVKKTVHFELVMSCKLSRQTEFYSEGVELYIFRKCNKFAIELKRIGKICVVWY